MTKRQLGVSVYPDHSDLKTDKAYLKQAADLGFSRVFMSMLEIKENKTKVIQKYQDLIQYAKKLQYEVLLDVAPAIFDQLGISYDQLAFFAELGADGIRLDQGFDGQKEALLSFNPEGLIIELNMSNDVAYLENILSYQANEPFIYGCHNFYPQRGTGLPLSFFEKCSRRFKAHNIVTAAFVSSQSGKLGPWDINDGLPTLEMHRDLNIETQAKHLFATGLIDAVIIGNSYASFEELTKLAHLDRYQPVFKVKLQADITTSEQKILLMNQHVRRGDITDLVIRSTEVRKIYQTRENPKHGDTHHFYPGDVVIGNDQFGKYKNELQLVLEEHDDQRKNKVAEVILEERFLIDSIKPWGKFKFEVAEND